MPKSNLIPFKFENCDVRVVMIDGEPWFVASDICGALGYQNTAKAIADHVDQEDRNTITIRYGNRGNPNVTVINESGLYALIFGSKLPKAKIFKRWVTKEVLPSIRKTGGYGYTHELPLSPKDTLTFYSSLADMLVSKVGVKADIATASVLTSVEKATGVDVSEFRKLLPGRTEPVETLNATQVGQLIGVSARTANRMLEMAGLQCKNRSGKWELTEQGMQYGAAYPYERNGHADYQIRWGEGVVRQLAAHH